MKTLLRCIIFSLLLISLSAFLTSQERAAAADEKKGPALFLERIPGSENANGLPKFRVEIRNPGDDDLVLNAGFMLGNGKQQYVKAVTLLVTDSGGKSREMELRGPWFVAGRIDPLVLPLPAGAAFSFPADLESYWCPATREVEYKYKGAYTIRAQYAGNGVSSQEANLDAKAVALMPYWVGSVTSNKLRFQVASR